MAEVSIILPTYNRAHLLPNTIDSVLRQSYHDWDLIVVDDRSTDNTADIVRCYSSKDVRIRYVVNKERSHCCAGARLRGLDEELADFVAFIDSDDEWPDYHLSDLTNLMYLNQDVDWIFGDLMRIDTEGRVIVGSKFREEWRGYGRFSVERRGELYVLCPDRIVENGILYGIGAGLQTSLLRSSVFSRNTIRDVFAVEDVLFALEVAASGAKIGYVNSCHLRYLVHDGNVSGANCTQSFEHLEPIGKELEKFYKLYIPAYIKLTPRQHYVLRGKLADHLVWYLGNGLYRAAGRRSEAACQILRGIRLMPWRLSYWKTFLGTLII